MLLILFSNRLGARIRCSLSSFPPAGVYGVLSRGGGTSLHTVLAVVDTELVVQNRVTTIPNILIMSFPTELRNVPDRSDCGMWNVWRREEVHTGFCWVNLKTREYFEQLDTCGKTI